MIDLRSSPENAAPPQAKAPAPGLDGRAPRPSVVRLKPAAVRLVAGGAALLLAGAFTWAFVIQPELRASARTRSDESARDEARRSVRPSEAVTAQPASYDRLPPLRQPADAAVSEEMRSGAHRPSAQPRRAYGSAPVSPEQEVRFLALKSDILFRETGPARTTASAPAASPSLVGAGEDAAESVMRERKLTPPLSPYELKAGTLLPAVLLTGVDTSRPGPVIAAVTQTLYDTVTGRHVVAPQGARLVGRHEGDNTHGERRAFIVWDRLILPNGKSIDLGGEAGVDAAGAVGLKGRVDRRLGALVTATLFGGAVTTLGQAARDSQGRGGGSFLGDAGDAAAIEGARVGGRLVDRELGVRPAVRVAAGARVQVMITRDLVLEAYQP
jgi:type IV secretion system protein VirB10